MWRQGKYILVCSKYIKWDAESHRKRLKKTDIGKPQCWRQRLGVYDTQALSWFICAYEAAINQYPIAILEKAVKKGRTKALHYDQASPVNPSFLATPRHPNTQNQPILYFMVIPYLQYLHIYDFVSICLGILIIFRLCCRYCYWHCCVIAVQFAIE